MPELLVVLLLATPLLAALACILPGFAAERAALSKAAVLLLLLFVVLLAARATQPGTHLGLGGLVLVDPATALILLTVAIPAAAGLLLSPAVSARRLAAHSRELGAIHLLIAALLFAAVCAHALLLWLSLVASVLLIGRLGAGKVAWRILLPCTLGLALALAALCLALPAGGDDWAALRHGAAANHGPARLSFVLALLGFGAVAGLVAPWAWLPDAGRHLPAPAIPLVQVGLPVCALHAIPAPAARSGPPGPA